MVTAGVDLSKILGANQNIGEQMLAITDESISASQLLGITCPGCSLKSTPMMVPQSGVRLDYAWFWCDFS